MVLRHFQLREQPFGVTPDPRYLYASPTHREALASLLYAIATGVGFVTLTGTPGMGKTTLLFDVLRRMKETTKTVFLFQTITTPAELVRALLLDMGVEDIPAGLVDMQTRLNELLVTHRASGRPLILIIDEAQNLNESVLEAVRMLSNFETASRKLMQIILSGQPQLAEILARPRMVQLRQRISVFARLQPLSESETAGYIHHRLEVAGFRSEGPIFTDAALALIARHGTGIPRQINNICFNALSLAYALQHKTIDRKVVEEVVADLEIEHHSPGGMGVEDQNGNAAGMNVPFSCGNEAPNHFLGRRRPALSW
jgi:general secretion pathway protein A